MSEPTIGSTKSRRQLLEEFVAQKPDDSFSRYALALECMNTGDAAAADEHFRALVERNPDYIPGFQMYGQFLAREERIEEARKIFTAGIAAATKAGNQHARSEMEASLEALR
jgi:predicted Zn-dependent protease